MMDSDSFEFEMTKHPSKVLEGLNSLRLNNMCCDVILCSRGKEFPCHRVVLASFSAYFQAMFTTAMMESRQHEVEINGVDPDMIDILVNYAYTAKVDISTTNVQALMAAANLLDFTAVKMACCRYMESHMDESNCVGIHSFAEAHFCNKLKRRSMDYIRHHFGVVYQQEEFLSLPVEKLTEILAGNHLNVSKEDMVFEAAMLWLNKCPSRKQSIEKVLEHVRLPLISPSYLRHVIESLDVVKENPGCQRFISEAKARLPVIVTVSAVEEGSYTHIVQSCDPLTRQWKTLGRLPLKVSGYAVTASGSALYVAGGEYSKEGPISKEMWRYDVNHNTWSKMADMYHGRCFHSLVMLDGLVVAVGGSYTMNTQDSIEFYNPNTNTWTIRKNVGVVSKSSLVVALDGLLYFIGRGLRASNHTYNYQTDVWTKLPPMLKPRDNPAACSLNGKVYVIGGRNSKPKRYAARTQNTMECYNPRTNQWTRSANLRVPRSFPRCFPSVAALDGMMYLLGGLDNNKWVHSIEQYCEETRTWQVVGRRGKLLGSSPHVTAVRGSSVCVRNDDAPTSDEDDE